MVFFESLQYIDRFSVFGWSEHIFNNASALGGTSATHRLTSNWSLAKILNANEIQDRVKEQAFQVNLPAIAG